MLIPQKLLSRIIAHFDGDINKARLWCVIPNPVLNGMRPCDYKINGSWDYLSKMINDALEEVENEQSE